MVQSPKVFSVHLYAVSIIAAGIFLWSGGPATASDSGKGMAPGEGMSSGNTNGVFSGIPDPNSPGGTKDAGKGSSGSTEVGTVRQGSEPDSGRSSNSSSGGDASGSSSNRSGSGGASKDMKAKQGDQRLDTPVVDKQVDTGMKEGELQNAKEIKGEILRIEGDQYYVAGEDGKEVGLHIDGTTQKIGDIQAGDRIEAQANEQRHALTIRVSPTTDRRNEHSSQ